MFKKGQVWKTMSNKTIVSNHPLLEEVTIIAQNVDIIASFFCAIKEIFCSQILEGYNYFSKNGRHLISTSCSKVLFFLSMLEF